MPQNIVDMANAAFSTMTQQQQEQQQEQQSATATASSSSSQGKQQTLQPDLSSSQDSNGAVTNLDDRLDAARAILGISPHSVIDTDSIQQASSSPSMKASQRVSADRPLLPQSNNGLDALAFLASKEQEHGVPIHSGVAVAGRNQANHNGRSARNMAVGHNITSPFSSLYNDDEVGNNAMPPPPPRDSASAIQPIQTHRQYSTSRRLGRPRSVSAPEGMEKWTPRHSGRLQLVLPAAILEEELAEASAAMEAKEAERGRRSSEESCYDDSDDWEQGRTSRKTDCQRHTQNDLLVTDEPAGDDKEVEDVNEEENDEDLEPSELLRRARSRLLEDLSQGNLNGEKGVFTAPHTLAKYKEVYNKNGRIGIYTPAERAAIIARFQEKRTKRVWNKKIRYNCRKNLADRRLRVKGRFVKRSVDTAEAAEAAETEKKDIAVEGDTDMPDVTDPNAGFAPTEDQPYRRLRRHTIT